MAIVQTGKATVRTVDGDITYSGFATYTSQNQTLSMDNTAEQAAIKDANGDSCTFITTDQSQSMTITLVPAATDGTLANAVAQLEGLADINIGLAVTTTNFSWTSLNQTDWVITAASMDTSNQPDGSASVSITMLRNKTNDLSVAVA